MRDYKIIIIGGGISGLSTGLAFSKSYNLKENPALIIEKQKTVGGCVTTFARDSYRFDTVQIIPDVKNLLKFFDISTDLVKFDHNYANLYLVNSETESIETIPVAADEENFQSYLCTRYQSDAKKIKRFFRYCNRMHSELKFLKTEPKILDIAKILIKCPKILYNSSTTYKAFLKKFKFKNPEVYEVLDVFSSFSGLSGNRCAALLTACAMVTTLKGSYRPKKGFITFPHLFRKKFIEMGGEVLSNTEVKQIITENNTVKGVILSDGTHIKSEIVVSTADTRNTFVDMTGLDILKSANKKYAEKVKNVKMSPSAIAIHIGLDDIIDLKSFGLDTGYNVITTGRATHEKLFDEWEQGFHYKSEKDFHFGVISPSATIGGKQTLILHVVPVPSQKWIQLRKHDYEKYLLEKNKIADFYIDLTEKYLIPKLRNHIKIVDVSTPATYSRYIGSPDGANFDMMPVPENFGKNRLKSRTPIDNLYIAKFSHGIWPSMQAGLQIADMISGGKIMKGNASYF
jgi:phytoene dehydrogenase-like protein